MPSFKWIVAVGAVACLGQSSHAALILTNAVAHWDFGTVAAPTPAPVAAYTPSGLTLTNVTAKNAEGTDTLLFWNLPGSSLSAGSYAFAASNVNPFTVTMTVAPGYELTLTHAYAIGGQSGSANRPNRIVLRGPDTNGVESNWGNELNLATDQTFRELTFDFPDRVLTTGSYTLRLFTLNGTRPYNIDNYTFYGSMAYVEAPEPATFGLAAVGLACLVGHRRRN